MINALTAKIDWPKILLAGVAAAALSLLIPTVIIALYAMILVFESGGAPDSVRLKQFAGLVGGWGAQVCAVASAFGAGSWVARRTQAAASLHGLLAGLAAATSGLMIGLAFSGALKPRMLIVFTFEAAAGWLGGQLGARRRDGMSSATLIKPRPAPASDAAGAAVIVEDLHKSYGEVRAVKGISFEVQSGEVFGLLGPNGAGKTTTVEIIEGLRQADRGTVRVCGFDPVRQAQELKERLGVSLQSTALPERITAREALALFASFYRWRANLEELLALVSLEEKANTRFNAMSGGQQQRLAVALALVNDPAVVILDEPTAGLDPQARRELHNVIARLREQGKTIMLTTHYIEEAEKLCDRVAIIDDGQIIALGSPRQLIARAHGHSRIEFTTSAPLQLAALRQIQFVDGVSEVAGAYVLKTADAPRTIVELIKWLEAGRHELLDLHITRPTLEDVFIELTGRRIRE